MIISYSCCDDCGGIDHIKHEEHQRLKQSIGNLSWPETDSSLKCSIVWRSGCCVLPLTVHIKSFGSKWSVSAVCLRWVYEYPYQYKRTNVASGSEKWSQHRCADVFFLMATSGRWLWSMAKTQRYTDCSVWNFWLYLVNMMDLTLECILFFLYFCINSPVIALIILLLILIFKSQKQITIKK